ncbi:hypothetical protein CNMCM6805_010060 [Aspergillus fumigatiaffinis]|uniref:Neutral metalloproteinase n=1 Tax=Aspergillus fumigatiaffinis TaxID=340414 RepID=A0A8H4M6S3_9EURO|nr:hypothetical protein CNMCM6805_010060 [Aspergillus fumigatiaffinis]
MNMAPSCGIIPEYVLQGIIEKRLAPQHVINRCQSTIEQTKQLQDVRIQHRESIAAAQQQQTSQVTEPVYQLNRTVYDAQKSRDDPPPHDKILIVEGGQLLTDEQDPTNNANECYTGLGNTYDFYFKVFQRDSIDNNGMKLEGFIHAGDLYNAYWFRQHLVFGDGDGIIFDGFTDELDVIGHEFTHGVVEYTSPLAYKFQSGALNESLSDVFGIMVKQFSAKPPQTVDQANWLIGETLWAAGVNGRALRDMKNPGTAFNDDRVGEDPQPAHWSDFKKLPFSNDLGGVHINSGIPNRAFVLAATMIGGYAWEGAGPIWYRALTSGKLRANATFREFADLTIENAGEHVDKIREAWKLVGYPFPENRNEL